MRLWTLHPKYLDSKGLVALWRESLLAQAVLKGQTKGYRSHPQLIRFRESESPTDSIAYYLHVVYNEAKMRNYNFDSTKFVSIEHIEPIPVTHGQLDYEWTHFKNKLYLRDSSLFKQWKAVPSPKAHPLFKIIEGPVADWEVRQKV